MGQDLGPRGQHLKYSKFRRFFPLSSSYFIVAEVQLFLRIVSNFDVLWLDKTAVFRLTFKVPLALHTGMIQIYINRISLNKTPSVYSKFPKITQVLSRASTRRRTSVELVINLGSTGADEPVPLTIWGAPTKFLFFRRGSKHGKIIK